MERMSNVRLFNPSTIHKPLGYTHVAEVTAGKLIYLSGQVAFDRDGNLVGKDDYEAQLRQVFSNLAAALDAAGATFQQVVKLNYYCVDSVDPGIQLTAVRKVRDEFVNTSAPPASTFIVVSRLARPEFLIEVEAVAAV